MTDSDTEPTVLFESHPSTRPTLAALGTTVVAGVAITGLLLGNAESLGRDVAETLAGVVGAVAALLVVRHLARIYVLRSTSYVVTETEIRREFALLFRRSSREVPIHQLRGISLSQSGFQRLLGYGSVSFLTAGPNHSLGFLSFDDVPDAEAKRDRIRDLVRVRRGESGAPADPDTGAVPEAGTA